MDTIRTIQNVTAPTLTVEVPAEFIGRQVEVIIIPVEMGQPLPPPLDPRYAPFIMPKPQLTEEDKKLLAANPFPLRGTGSEYVDPFEAAVPAEDWDVYRHNGGAVP